ncbi:MAG: hypothetical protein E7603_03880 [Ruminococcaceae bacterium]|nr:hypothetical protein [Oscillospiraceae bacterium]
MKKETRRRKCHCSADGIKIRMNRFFCERVRGSYLPYPEVDNFFERTRSRLFVKLKKMRRK